ncbi:MAG TPA: hypothetical protein PK970_02480 [Hyphomicrobiaceae bacterium]|nr:hypothetical protein [Hyphomicrobiaceae bacterium]
MVKEGLYSVVFGGAAYETASVFVLREGRIGGLSFQGSEYEGTYRYNADRDLVEFDMTAHFVPNVLLVTGLQIPETGARLHVAGEAPVATPTSRFSIVIADKPVDVAMTYVRPLP